MAFFGFHFVPVREWSFIGYLVLVLVVTIIMSLVSRVCQYSRLYGFNGPILAGFSRLWLVQTVWSGKAYLHFWDVTRKYGMFM